MAICGVHDSRCVALREADRLPGGYDFVRCRLWRGVTGLAVSGLPRGLVKRLICAAGEVGVGGHGASVLCKRWSLVWMRRNRALGQNGG